MANETWQRRAELERRYDGPVPAWERAGPDDGAALRRRMRLHRRQALDYAAALRRCPADPVRLLRLLRTERRAHSRLARLLGQALRE